MKKSLKLMVSTLMLASPLLGLALHKSVVAQGNHEQLFLVRDWMQRSHQEVSQSINQDLHSGDTYTIRWGDTLATIAQIMRMSVEEIATLNGITDTNFIVAGNILRFNGLTANDSLEQGIQMAIAGESSQEIFEEEIEEVAETVVEETSAALTFDDPTEIPVYEDRSMVAAYEETTTAPVYEETTATPVYEEETTATPVYEETTVAPSNEEVTTATPVYVEETTAAPEPEVLEPETYSSSFGPEQAREAFNQIVAEKGLSQSEISGWEMIIQRESGWNTTIANPYSGAYGLPQSLPGNKMASHGADWQTNPYTQLAWMYDYMVNRYGSIQGAVNFWNANHWY